LINIEEWTNPQLLLVAAAILASV